MTKILLVNLKGKLSQAERDNLWGTDIEGVEVSEYDQVLEQIRCHHPDLVILDGIGASCLQQAEETIARIREPQETQDTSLAILTSLDISPSEEQRLIGRGANIIIPVPSEPKLWNLKLEKLLNIPARHRFRVPVQMMAWTKIKGHDNLVQGMALNISVGGMLLQLPVKLIPDGKFDVIFHLPKDTRPLSVVGRIVWRNKTSQKYGVEFLAYRDDSRERLTWFLNETYESYQKAQDTHSYPAEDASREALWELLLRTTEARKNAIMNAVCDCLIAVDYENRIVEFNETAEKTFGYAKSDILLQRALDKLFSKTLCQSLRAQLFEFVSKGKNDNQPALIEDRAWRADHTEFPIEVRAHPIYFERESLLILYVKDITERKRAEQERAKLEENFHHAQKIESVGRLAGGVAHDYNNMLSVIIGYAELAQLKADSAGPIQEDLDQILKAAKRSRDITRQLLTFARKQTIAPQIVDLNATVEPILKMLRQLLGENIDLIWHPKQNLWPVEVDPNQVEQILANLCINARDAIGGIGTMTIETDMASIDPSLNSRHPDLTPGDFVMLSVSDNGCGMDKETLDRIFEPFFTTKQAGEGTGLGLATVYGSVKQSQGFIKVDSQPEGGSTFKIYLPRSRQEAVTRQAPSLGEGEIIKGQGETVLVVEDEGAILELTTTILEDLDYQVVPAISPSDALAQADRHHKAIDVLLTDVVMPEMNGRELADRLQLTRPALKCLFMSGYTENAIVHNGVVDKDVLFIQKPFSKGALSAHIHQALNGKGPDRR